MRALVDRYLDAYNRMDVDAMLATMQDEVVFENYTGGVLALRTMGIAELRHLAESSRHLFSMRRQTVTAWREADGCGYAGIRFEGTFAIDLPNGVRAGQSIVMEGRSEFRQHDGRLVYIADHSG
ncbi:MULTISPECIES: nuclear transport factor 2 family protein [Rhodanobacter]|uniref:Nuclear transport factor 2 family protein n=1 Tax=Rhodanobacter hydrolyticus TaxID=2250595 RepID=A0ABW8J8A0_9GAMM|nr:nuclear transport factor 2 family protein [Rhodanobacter sp. 7MK24]MBD8880103.1 nuclear transport factor 2 family protein [Rhodanobacter sp. 7MK24]